MDFITNIHGKIVPHDGGRGFCGAQVLQRELLDVNELVREMIVLLRSEAIRYSITFAAELAEGIDPRP